MSHSVHLDRVTMAFGDTKAVDDVSFEVEAGGVLLDPRPVGLRQDHDPAHGRGLPRADRRARA